MDKADLGKHCCLLYKPRFPRCHHIWYTHTATECETEMQVILKSIHCFICIADNRNRMYGILYLRAGNDVLANTSC